jgi:predicted transcriptional regulator
MDWDNKVLKTEKVEYGKSATAPANPVREGYTFTGWSASFDKIVSDLTVWAQYEINTYTVTFYDKDGNVLSTQTVNWNEAATAPADPVWEGHTFMGWNVAFNHVKSDLEVRPIYDVQTFTVTFIGFGGTELKKEKVEYGKAATAPDAPEVAGYTFKGWDKDFSNITADLTVIAQYTINSYTVTFVDWDNTVLKTEKVEYGKTATAPSDPKREGYTFSGWDKDFSNITSDLTVTAQYKINSFTVTFMDWDNKVLKTEKVEYGKAATAPANPVREGYTFTGWSASFDKIVSDLTVWAQYKINTYTVTFYDKDGNILSTQTVNWNEAATAPADPVWEGHTFMGWNVAFNHVKSDLEVRPIYDVQTFTVTFIGFGGTELKKEKVEYGKSATAPDAPEVAGYTFKGWDKDFSNITADLTVTAIYEENPVVDYTPKNLAVVVVPVGDDDLQITLSWDKVEGVVSYELQLMLGDQELYAGNTFGMNVVSLKLSDIQKYATIEPGTYTLDWAVRSTDVMGQAVSDWAHGASFTITVKESGEGINDLNGQGTPAARKVLINGRYYILTADEVYDFNGRKVQ